MPAPDGVDELIDATLARTNAERAEKRRQAALARSNAPRHRYQPFGTAVDAFRFKGPELLYAGPAGTGKSKCLLEKMHAVMLKYPGARGLIVRKTLASLGSTALVTYEEHVAKEHIQNGEVRWYGGSAKEAACYKYANGSRLVVGGMDKAMKIMSSEYDVVYAQEATELTEEDWEAITTRLRNGKMPYQQLIADANPDVPTHWLKVRCDTKKTHYIRSRHEDNPVLFHQTPDGPGALTEVGENYMAKLDALTGVRYQRLRKGIWCAAEGLVYEEFNPDVHLHRRIGRPPISWTRYITVDFGYTNPMVVQFWAEDEDGRLYLYKELYATKTTVDAMAPKILKAMDLNNNPRPRAIICDHDAEGRAVLERELGMSTTAAKKSVEDGIQAVKKRLLINEADGRPGLYLCQDALVERDKELSDKKKPTCTIDEIVGYIWDRGTVIAQNNGKPPKEMPVKADDHGMDALRYMVAFRDLKARPRIRSIEY
ncbi:terminase large subunit [Streptomyces phage Dagobah]|nr:terminase large subunit [Streptomyces phage Dagobah]